MTESTAVTDQVIASFAAAAEPRFRELMEALVRHAHAFAREVALTEPEWAAGIDFLTRCGQLSDERRQEFILLSDVLGVSMLTIDLNQAPIAGATEATVFGPFFVDGSPRIELGGDLARGAAGQPCWVSGTVRGVDGEPIAGARLEVWEADEAGFYDTQYDDDRSAARGHLFSGADGGYAFWGLRPTPYPIPHDGPVGELLKAAGRGPMRASHLHFMVTAPGYRRLITHIFVRGDAHLDSDAVFGVKDSLVLDFVTRPAGSAAPGGRPIDGPWSSVTFDIVLAPDNAPAFDNFRSEGDLDD